MTDGEEKSEFGAGIVVCLAKFSEHLLNDMATQLFKARQYLDSSPERQAEVKSEAAKFPHGDAAQVMSAVNLNAYYMGSREEKLSRQIELWMNGASDHFYDLDKERAPQPLRELAELTLRIGHGFTGEIWTMKHVERIRELWKESCLAVDRMLGIENPDWGAW